MKRKLAFVILAVFVVVSAFIVGMHAFVLGRGLRADMTISRYVGLDFWSAGLFLLANMVLAVLWVRFALSVANEWCMSRLWRVITVTAAVMLILLSVFPMGLYDANPGEMGLISKLHRFSSCSMFGLMITSDLGLFLRVRKTGFRAYSAMYMVYGFLMALLMALDNPWFWGNSLWLESLFLLGYLVMFCILPNREGEKKQECVIMG